jgi:uncharacterized protein YceK
MKIITISIGILLLGACATVKTTSTSSKTSTSKSTSSKDAKVGNKQQFNELPATKYPNSADTSNTAPAPYNSGDLKSY